MPVVAGTECLGRPGHWSRNVVFGGMRDGGVYIVDVPLPRLEMLHKRVSAQDETGTSSS